MTGVTNWIWLSHVSSPDTPMYGGGSGIEIIPDKQQHCGDSCNTVNLTMSNHMGSHVDAPRHFVRNGKCVDDYVASDWIFSSPLLIDVPETNNSVIDIERVKSVLNNKVLDVDLIIIRTGIETYRHEDRSFADI